MPELYWRQYLGCCRWRTRQDRSIPIGILLRALTELRAATHWLPTRPLRSQERHACGAVGSPGMIKKNQCA
jgi:hypothetical protein